MEHSYPSYCFLRKGSKKFTKKMEDYIKWKKFCFICFASCVVFYPLESFILVQFCYEFQDCNVGSIDHFMLFDNSKVEVHILSTIWDCKPHLIWWVILFQILVVIFTSMSIFFSSHRCWYMIFTYYSPNLFCNKIRADGERLVILLHILAYNYFISMLLLNSTQQ